MQQLQNVIESAFERRADITPANVDTVTASDEVRYFFTGFRCTARRRED